MNNEKKVSVESITDLVNKRKYQIEQQDEAPDEVKNYFREFSKLILRLEDEAGRDFISAYPYLEDRIYNATVKLLGEGIEISYVPEYKVIELFRVKEGIRELLEIIRYENGSFLSSYTGNQIRPDDLLNYMKSTDIYQHLEIIINE